MRQQLPDDTSKPNRWQMKKAIFERITQIASRVKETRDEMDDLARQKGYDNKRDFDAHNDLIKKTKIIEAKWKTERD
jgi:flagellar hook-associated protein FlgK